MLIIFKAQRLSIMAESISGRGFYEAAILKAESGKVSRMIPKENGGNVLKEVRFSFLFSSRTFQASRLGEF